MAIRHFGKNLKNLSFTFIVTLGFFTLLFFSLLNYPESNAKRFFFSEHNVNNNTKIVSLMHIPKTAITSLYMELHRKVPFAFKSPGEDEQCRFELEKKQGGNRLGTLFRDPIKHVYSQYLECKYDIWGKQVTYGTEFPRPKNESEATGYMPGFEKWLEHFLNPKVNPKNDFNCYHPKDMQTRYLHSKNNCHHFDLEKKNIYDPSETKSIIKKIWFVGISDYFKASICLLEFQIWGYFSNGCDCRKKIVRTYVHETHNVPPHSTNVLNKRTKEMIKQLTTQDEITYKFALEEFKKRVALVKKHTKVQLLCNQDSNV